MAQIGNLGVNVAPADDFAPLPAGEYVAVITASEMKQNNAKTGHYLNLSLEITEGQYQNRKLWDLLNLDNPNPKAVEIAERTLRSIREATDQLGATTSEEFHYKPMVIRVVVEEQPGYSPKNAIKAYKKKEGAQAGGSPFGQPQSSGAPDQSGQTTTSPSDGAKPFWANKAA